MKSSSSIQETTSLLASDNHSINHAVAAEKEKEFRENIKYFFSNPCINPKANKLSLCNLCWQFLKIILITVQIIFFANQRSGTVDYFERNELALKHIFLKNWEAAYETMPYPPAVGNYAVYTKQDLIGHINHIMQQYYRMPQVAIGTFFWEVNDANGTESVPPPIEMCKTSYNEVSIFENKSFIIDPDVHTICFPIEPIVYENKTVSYDIIEYLKEKNLTILFSRLIKIELNIAFRSYHLDLLTRHTGPACFKTEVSVLFDNHQRNGQTLIDLNTQITEIECDCKILSEDVKAEERQNRIQVISYDSVVMLFESVSCILCFALIVNAQKLRKEAVEFFDQKRIKLTLTEQLEFLNLWYILIIISDILSLAGSCFKIMLESEKFSSFCDKYDQCSILLGVGCLLAWCSLFRYFGFCPKSVLIESIKKAAFPMFIIYAPILFSGFMLCGWVVLGPHHVKFRYLSTTLECLFSLVNGDEMFVTFSATQTSNDLVWYFSRIYFCIFIGLFIYFVLNVFLAVILNISEKLQEYSKTGVPESNLLKFIEECKLPKLNWSFRSLFPCFKKKESDGPPKSTSSNEKTQTDPPLSTDANERTPLVKS